MNDEGKDSKVYLGDILTAISKINEFTSGMGKDEFRSSSLVLDAVLRNIEVIGEAASKLPAAFRSEHKEIDWQDIIGMRNKLIHAYSEVDAGRHCLERGGA